MVKVATLWSTNSTKNADAVLYSSASVLYSSPSVYYTSSTAGQNELNKPATSWANQVKIASAWQYNPAFSINQYAYDSSMNTYDDALQTYDGANGSQSPAGTKPATAWTVL